MNREYRLFRVEVPSGVQHSGRLVARALKCLLRGFGLRAVATLEAPSETEPNLRFQSRTRLK
jgi:hypothetical protein